MPHAGRQPSWPVQKRPLLPPASVMASLQDAPVGGGICKTGRTNGRVHVESKARGVAGLNGGEQSWMVSK